MNRRVLLTRPVYKQRVSPHVDRRSPSSINSPGREEGVREPPLREGGSQSPLPTADGPRSKLNELLEAAKALPAAEQKELLDHLALQTMLPMQRANDREQIMWSGAVYEALVDRLGAAGGAMGGPQVIKRYVALGPAWASVEQFMSAARLTDLDVRQKQSFYNLLARLLVQHAAFVAKKSGAPLSPKLIANCTGALAGVFDGAFPGYLRAGLAPIVARQVAAGIRHDD